MTNINRVTITGNLTRDPDIRSLGEANAVCNMRVACSQRHRDREGKWESRPNYFDVTVWGAQATNAHRFLRRGRPVAIDGHLQWREWTTKNGDKRQTVGIVADVVQFLGEPPKEEPAAVEPASENGHSAPDTADPVAENGSGVALTSGYGF